MRTNCDAFVYNDHPNKWRKCKLVGTSVKNSKYKQGIGENLGLIWEGYLVPIFSNPKKHLIFLDLKVMGIININQCMVL